MDKYYKILGLTESATDEEIKEAYFELRAKYKEDRFLDGEEGNEAARKLTELERAYEEITTYRREHAGMSEESLLSQVDAAIKQGDLSRAQQVLDSFNERPAEWHYLQSVVFYQKGWANESKKQLEIALQMDPSNAKYKSTLERLNEKIKGPQGGKTSAGAGGAYGYQNQNNNGANYDEPQMGNEGCFDFCCRLAICNLMLNCCCNCR
ncbi:MAG: DnaJ domain-containing protein [Clostridia bacterium]|nr:DnaJ domain-containing protein [Clostridia bacterium]